CGRRSPELVKSARRSVRFRTESRASIRSNGPMLESLVEKKLSELQASGRLPLAVELWNGHRFEPAEHPPVTLRVPRTSSLMRLANPDLAALGEAYVEGEVDIEGPIDEAFRAAEKLARGWGKSLKGRLPRLGLHTKMRD